MALFVGIALLCLAWLIPYHFVPWPAFQQEWLAALGGVVIGTAALTQQAGGSLRWPPLALLVLACAGIPLGQTVAGHIHFLSDGLLPMLYLVAFALSMVAGATLVDRRRADLLDGLSAAVVVAGFISTGVAMFQWLQLGPGSYMSDLAPGARPYANLNQPNHLATLLCLGVLALVRGYETRRIGGLGTALGVAWLGFGLLMTQSRAGWLIVLFVVLAWAALRRQAGLRMPPRAVIPAAFAFFVGVMMWGPVTDTVGVPSNDLEERLQAGTRPALWLNLWDALWRSPWVGYGWSQVVHAQQVAALDQPAMVGMLFNSHNLALDLMLWNGVPVGLLLIGALGWWFWRQVKLCSDVDRWSLLVPVGIVFVHELVEFPLDYAFFLLPVGLMMGALDGMDGTTRAWRAPKFTLAMPLVLLTGMLVWIGAEYMRTEDAARQMRLVQMGVGVDKVSSVPAPEVRLLDALREYHRFWLARARPGMTEAELDWMRSVVRRYPAPPAQLRYALAAGLNGRQQDAIETLGRICAMQQPIRCVEARESWELLRRKYPELHAINPSWPGQSLRTSLAR